MNKTKLDDLYAVAQRKNAMGNDQEYLKLIIDLSEKGYYKAQIELGSIYLAGFCSIERNIDMSLKWHLKAKDSKNPDNYHCLGMLYSRGFEGPNKTYSSSEIESTEYYSLAFKGYMVLANKGDTKAIYRVGEMYSMGLGVDTDENEAKIWFGKYHDTKNNVDD
ncbi:MAG: sel1 repeat family protein [Ectothiorhodospiraceae bacterium]|nr:sel1 repeat family protein [Ectothiorhodospiraceae bacterium]